MRKDVISVMGDPDNIVRCAVFVDKFKGGGGGVGTAEGTREDEVGPGFVADHDGEEPEGREDGVEAGGVVRAQGPHGDDEVEGLQLMDEGVGRMKSGPYSSV